ncbi:hypothetical protein LIER_14980 [Lithospermum erythrorhizon]|uniref:Uncharacterized protein n=1 Tax=Lithospermum erythrorhizon TaxID=34254 RepID=A0AAV3Q2M7_LITER
MRTISIRLTKIIDTNPHIQSPVVESPVIESPSLAKPLQQTYQVAPCERIEKTHSSNTNMSTNNIHHTDEDHIPLQHEMNNTPLNILRTLRLRYNGVSMRLYNVKEKGKSSLLAIQGI